MPGPSAADAPNVPLTVESAAKKLEAMFAAEGETHAPEPPKPAAAAPPAKADETPAPAPSPDEPKPAVEDEAEPVVEEEPTDEETPHPRTFKVKVDGQEAEVTEEELLKGYSRQEHFTRNSQKLADERNAFEAERDTKAQEVAARRQELETRLTTVHQTLEALTPPEPNWDELRAVHPAADVNAAYAAFHEQKKRLDKIAEARDHVRAENEKALEKQAETYLAREREKVREVIPDWIDPVKEAAGRTELATYAKGLGFSDAELASVVDHRLMVVLHKALLHDKTVAAKPAIENRITDALRTTPPGSPAAPRTTSALTKAKQRLAQTGRLDDMVAGVEALL